MNFFRDVVSHLLKNAFEGHTKFSVADNTAVGDNPVRSISLDAVPSNENTIISLSWDGGEKLFEKTLSEQEASHQFDLISTDLAEVSALTKQGQYDAAKDLMTKLGQKYAENTGDIVQTNLPKLHNTQASADGKVWKEAKITMQNLWFSNTDELLEYQEKQKKANPAANQDHIPLWDAQKGKGAAPQDELAPASLSYEDLQNEKERDHEDMQKHIDEKIKTELESALQEKAASVFGPDQIELVKVLRKNGRNWDEIKKILVKDFGFEKDSVNIFVDEQRQGADPMSVEVKPEEEKPEDKKPLTPPEELVSPETHEKLLQDHEDKKKVDSPVTEEPSLSPQDIMNIPEDNEIEEASSLSNEIARADNDDIHKVAAAPTDLNPLQEPLQEKPTTPQQDVVPMGEKPMGHDAPQKGDRVFVSSDLSGEKAGFEATYISNYKSQGIDFSIVETDQGDLLDIESNRVVKTSEGSGAQEVEPVMEPMVEKTKEQEIPTTPKMDDFHTSEQDPFLAIKKEAEALLQEIDELGKIEYKFVKKGFEKQASDSAYEANGWTRVWVDETEIEADQRYPEILKVADENARITALKELAREIAEQTLSLKANAGGDIAQMWFDSLSPSDRHDRVDWVKLATPQTSESSLKTDAGAMDTKCEDCGKPLGPEAFLSKWPVCGECTKKKHKKVTQSSDFEKGISQNKTSAEPEVAPKTQFKDYKKTPNYVPKEQAVPATPEMGEVLGKIESLQSNLATLKEAREQIMAQLQAQMTEIDEKGERAQMEAALQEAIEKSAVLLGAMENKVVQWKDKLYTLQTEEIKYVPKLTPTQMLEKIYSKFAGAEKYVQDVLNGMLSLGKNVVEKTLIRWPNKKSSVNKEASILDEINRFNEELLAALKELSSPL